MTLLTEENVRLGFHALSDSTRLQIIELLLDGGTYPTEMCSHLDIAQSKLSFHLNVLKKAGLVTATFRGKWNLYSLNLDMFEGLKNYLSEFED